MCSRGSSSPCPTPRRSVGRFICMSEVVDCSVFKVGKGDKGLDHSYASDVICIYELDHLHQLFLHLRARAVVCDDEVVISRRVRRPRRVRRTTSSPGCMMISTSGGSSTRTCAKIAQVYLLAIQGRLSLIFISNVPNFVRRRCELPVHSHNGGIFV